MIINKNVNKQLETLLRRYPELEPVRESLQQVYFTLEKVFFNSRILFICGNGGSACDGEHIVGELMKSFLIRRGVSDEWQKKFTASLKKDDNVSQKLQMGLRAVSLNSHPGFTSAYINDVDAEMTYAQQLFVLGSEGDAVLGISTSGNARNVCNTFKVGRVKGIRTILLTGANCGICEAYADDIIKVPCRETYQIQELHLPIYHTLCMMLEERFYGKQ